MGLAAEPLVYIYIYIYIYTIQQNVILESVYIVTITICYPLANNVQFIKHVWSHFEHAEFD